MKTSSSSGTSDFGLLLLRLTLGLNLFFHHGMEKITHFSAMRGHFPDPIHIGSHASLLFALISDGICSLLVALGLGTRVAALVIFVNVSMAFYFANHHPFTSAHGEMLLLYIGGFLALLYTGGGRLSLDWKLWGRS